MVVWWYSPWTKMVKKGWKGEIRGAVEWAYSGDPHVEGSIPGGS